MFNNKNKFLFFMVLSIVLMPFCGHAAFAAYENVFLSYYTPKNVEAMVNYTLKHQLGGVIVWEFRGDVPLQSSDSLLKTAVSTYQLNINSVTPFIMGYWSNWNVYTADSASRAIPQPAYGVPGSVNSVTGELVMNADFTQKLEAMNIITYAFLEAQTKQYRDYLGRIYTNPNPSQIGRLYFSDPWADLAKNDSFCSNGNLICWYATRIQNKPDGESAKMGNFEAFSALQHADKNNPLGELKKIFAVGGAGHDDTFEDIFGSESYLQNFVTSASEIIAHYHLDGIDLDYENLTMSYEQSQQFLVLIQKLRAALGKDKIITVTVLSDPDYLTGKTNHFTSGFDPKTSVLRQISQLADRINLMTYDFHGAFDYDKGKGRTGFLTNLYPIPVADLPPGYNPRFSVDAAVQALLSLGIDSNRINVGIPAYGRALAGISKENGGLFQVIPETASIPRGDMDSATCLTAITPLGGNSCSGGFQYSTIISMMRDKGFVQQPVNAALGTTAYADHWSTIVSNHLEITNTGSGSDLGFQVSILDSRKQLLFGLSDWLAVGSGKVYDAVSAVSTASIEGKNGLIVHWSTGWGPEGNCKETFNFTANMHVMVKVNNQGKAICDIKRL